MADLWAYFERMYGVDASQQHVDEVFARVHQIADFPESGVLHQGRRSGVRRWRAGLYFVLYTFNGQVIRVQRVLNTRRGDLETEI